MDLINDKLLIKTLGFTDIQYNGKSIFAGGKIAKKVKTLLQYFIANPNKVCTLNEISSALWWDREYKTAKSKLTANTVYKLKFILAKNNVFNMDFSEYISITYNKVGYKMTFSDKVGFDTDILSKLAQEAAELSEFQDLLNMEKRVQNIYADHFMSDNISGHKVVFLQNRYHNMYCMAIAEILEKLSRLKKYEEMVSICERFFEKDKYNDKINYIFLQLLIETNQNASALRHCENLIQNMSFTPPQDNAISRGGTVKDIIGKLIDEDINKKSTVHSVLKIELFSDTKINNSSDILKKIIAECLRREDICLLDERTAIVLLYKAKEKTHESIKERIEKYFAECFREGGIGVSISISPAFYVD